jgi:hypothetical protein
LGKNINIENKNTEILLDAGKEVYLEVNTEKIKCVCMSRQPTTGQNSK